ncbi:hypothetical protein E2562_030896 [Oryza meyeriana var. granulata]|uniref:F-box associated domain-containing protein n=1 Tax=Oryza meyeriana var. granulata TaxID=110450 RepID=A0A6G1F037_9ORYZ|nr:hypothetical protein E2562_030896 [Oryza meyeriana var. granulata]
MTILELHGELCVACSHGGTDTIDIWMVKEDGAWSVEYRVELREFSPEYSSETATPMAIDPMDGRILLNKGQSLHSGHNAVIFTPRRHGRAIPRPGGVSLGYYDPKTATLETIYSVSIPDDDNGWWYRFCPVICQESLVKVDRRQF